MFHFNTTGITVLLDTSCDGPASRLSAAWTTLADNQKETKYTWTDELEIMEYTELIYM